MRLLLTILPLLLLAGPARLRADEMPDVKMKYVSSFDEAKGISRRTGKPVFINFYAAWAGPCQAMDKYVFSDAEFAGYMDKNFVNYFVNVKSDEGKELTKQYGVQSFAYYAIVDCNGNVIQPISTGAILPEFKNKVALALSPKTSLRGTREKYESGKFGKKDLRNYLVALRVAGEGKQFHQLMNEYIGMLEPKEFLQRENWDILSFERDRNNGFFRNVVGNKAEFVKKFGLKAVDDYLGRTFSRDALKLAVSDCDPAEAEAIGRELAKAGLPDTSKVAVVYQAGVLRANRRYADLFKFMDENGHYLTSEVMLRPTIERSFNFPSLKSDDKKALTDYLERAIKRETPNNARHLENLLNTVNTPYTGIVFTDAPFAEVLAKAKQEGKLVFIDCYTSWCGPCRAMANNVFPLSEVGDFYNDNFICAKIDMEKGEGPALREKYAVQAFPTLLYLDGDGNLVEKAVGYKQAGPLIEAGKKALKK